MNLRSITIFRTYQLSTHRTLGFFTGDEDAVVDFCHLKYDIELDDIAIERVPIRKVTRAEVLCLWEMMEQLRGQKQMLEAQEEPNKEAEQAQIVVALPEGN